MIIKNLEPLKEKTINYCLFIHQRRKVCFLIFLVFVFLIAGITFFRYAYQVAPSSGHAKTKKIQIKEELYEKIIDDFRQREEKIKEIEKKSYPDPFK